MHDQEHSARFTGDGLRGSRLDFFADPRFPVVPETMADELPREGLHQIPAYARQSLFQQSCGQLSERG